MFCNKIFKYISQKYDKSSYFSKLFDQMPHSFDEHPNDDDESYNMLFLIFDICNNFKFLSNLISFLNLFSL
jgi:hypothetical protein